MNGAEQLQLKFKKAGYLSKLGGFIDTISKPLEEYAFLTLLLWVISPIGAMLLSNLSEEEGMYKMVYKIIQMSESWYIILLISGYAGCILGLIAFMKSIRDANTGQINWRQYVSRNLSTIFLAAMLYWSIISFLAGAVLSKYMFGRLFSREGIISSIAYFGIFCCGYILSNKRLVIGVIKFFTWIASILSILMFINIEELNTLFCLTSGSAAFFNINHFAYFLCMAVMASLYLFEAEKKSKPRIILRITMFSIITAALIINGSLGPYLAALAALIVSFILAVWLDKKRVKRVLIGIIIFLLLSVILNIGRGYLFADLRMLGLEFSDILGGQALDSMGSNRWGLWKNAFQITLKYPILGCGSGRYGDIASYYFNEEMRPHNEILEYSSTIGIPGLLFYLLALFFYLKDFLKKRKQVSLLVTGLSCVLAAYLVSSLFGVTVFYTSPFFFMFLGLSVRMLKEIPESKEEVIENCTDTVRNTMTSDMDK